MFPFPATQSLSFSEVLFKAARADDGKKEKLSIGRKMLLISEKSVISSSKNENVTENKRKFVEKIRNDVLRKRCIVSQAAHTNAVWAWLNSRWKHTYMQLYGSKKQQCVLLARWFDNITAATELLKSRSLRNVQVTITAKFLTLPKRLTSLQNLVWSSSELW